MCLHLVATWKVIDFVPRSLLKRGFFIFGFGTGPGVCLRITKYRYADQTPEMRYRIRDITRQVLDAARRNYHQRRAVEQSRAYVRGDTPKAVGERLHAAGAGMHVT